MKNNIRRLIAFLLVAMMSLSLCFNALAAADLVKNFTKTSSYSVGQFFDVKSSDWFAAGVQNSYELGLMKGNSDTTFNPNGKLTVAEAIVIASRMHNIYAGTPKEFIQGNPWYQVYVDYALQNGIIKAGQFSYNMPITREEFAYIMCGALPSYELESINTISSLPDVQENSTYGGHIFRLYRSGVLTGNDEQGTYSPKASIQRNAVAVIISRMIDKSQRVTRDIVSSTSKDSYLQKQPQLQFDSYYACIMTITLPTKAEVENIYREWLKGEATAESFSILLDKYGSSQGGGQIHIVPPGMWVTEVDNWCFDITRCLGDVAIIENVYGFTMCYFAGAVDASKY